MDEQKSPAASAPEATPPDDRCRATWNGMRCRERRDHDFDPISGQGNMAAHVAEDGVTDWFGDAARAASPASETPAPEQRQTESEFAIGAALQCVLDVVGGDPQTFDDLRTDFIRIISDKLCAARSSAGQAIAAIEEALEVMENGDAPSIIELPVATDAVASRYSHVHQILSAYRDSRSPSGDDAGTPEAGSPTVSGRRPLTMVEARQNALDGLYRAERLRAEAIESDRGNEHAGSEDTARLDWLEVEVMRLIRANPLTGPRVLLTADNFYLAGNVRKAIDASRSSSTPAAQPETNDAPSSQPTPETT